MLMHVSKRGNIFMNLKEFKEQSAEFIIYLEVERNLSDHTLRAYTSDLALFATFWQTILVREKIEIPLSRAFERYLVSLYHKKTSNSSIARKVSCFHSFAEYTAKHGILLNLQLERPRVERKIPQFLSVDELFHLLDTIQDQDLPTARPLRDKAILELLYATGIRCSELVGIKLEHINLQEKTILILGKGRKERMVLFGAKAKERIELYLSAERPRTSDGKEPLFVNNRSTELTTRSVQRIIKMFRQFLQLDRTLTPHKIRHSFATHLLNQGADLRLVQELLGHKTLSSTERYTHVSLERLSNLCDTIHPMQDMTITEKEKKK